MNDIAKIREAIRVNPNVVLQVWPTFVPWEWEPRDDEFTWSWNKSGREVVLRFGKFPLYVRAEPGDPVYEEARSGLIIIPAPPKIVSWGLVKLGAHVWAVTPSIHTPGMIHAYVTLCEVPEPAPWEET